MTDETCTPTSNLQLKRYDMWMAEDGINPRESSRGAYVLAHEALAEIERLNNLMGARCAGLIAELEWLRTGIRTLQATCCGDDPEKCHGCRALLGLLAAPESRDG